MVGTSSSCVVGSLAGNTLGSLVEFQTPRKFRWESANGVQDLADRGSWNTIPGQTADNSGMALSLAHLLSDSRRCDPEEAEKAYPFKLDSGPVDCGMTGSSGLRVRPNQDSQANGVMMGMSFHVRSESLSTILWN